jgi:hypothetical protein
MLRLLLFITLAFGAQDICQKRRSPFEVMTHHEVDLHCPEDEGPLVIKREGASKCYATVVYVRCLPPKFEFHEQLHGMVPRYVRDLHGNGHV